MAVALPSTCPLLLLAMPFVVLALLLLAVGASEEPELLPWAAASLVARAAWSAALR